MFRRRHGTIMAVYRILRLTCSRRVHPEETRHDHRQCEKKHDRSEGTLDGPFWCFVWPVPPVLECVQLRQRVPLARPSLPCTLSNIRCHYQYLELTKKGKVVSVLRPVDEKDSD